MVLRYAFWFVAVATTCRCFGSSATSSPMSCPTRTDSTCSSHWRHCAAKHRLHTPIAKMSRQFAAANTDPSDPASNTRSGTSRRDEQRMSKNGIWTLFYIAWYFLLTLLSLTFRECVSDSDSPRPESLSIFALPPRAPNRTSKFEQSEWDPAVFSEALVKRGELSLEDWKGNKYVMI